MARKIRQKRKAKIKNTPKYNEKIHKNNEDELIDDSVESNDNEMPSDKVEYDESIAETSDYSNEKGKFSCAVSIKGECTKVKIPFET